MTGIREWWQATDDQIIDVKTQLEICEAMAKSRKDDVALTVEHRAKPLAYCMYTEVLEIIRYSPNS